MPPASNVEITVLVHPHYLMYNTLKTQGPVELRAQLNNSKIILEPIQRIAPQHAEALSENIALHEWYKRQIDLIASKPNTYLFIVEGAPGELGFNSSLMKIGLTEEAARKLYEHFRSYQQDLVAYARSRLGSRVSTVKIPLFVDLHDNVPPSFSNFIEKAGIMQPASEIAVTVFGERCDGCAQQVFGALHHYYKNTKHDRLRCVE